MYLDKPVGHGFNSHHLHRVIFLRLRDYVLKAKGFKMFSIAAVAELVDALDLKSSCSDTVRVRFPPAARVIVLICVGCVSVR